MSRTPAQPISEKGRAIFAASASATTATASRAARCSRSAPTACSTAFASTPRAVWASAARGRPLFDPDGTLIGKILIPEIVANVTFGGAKRNRLFICGTTSLYAAMLMTNGSKLG